MTYNIVVELFIHTLSILLIVLNLLWEVCSGKFRFIFKRLLSCSFPLVQRDVELPGMLEFTTEASKGTSNLSIKDPNKMNRAVIFWGKFVAKLLQFGCTIQEGSVGETSQCLLQRAVVLHIGFPFTMSSGLLNDPIYFK